MLTAMNSHSLVGVAQFASTDLLPATPGTYQMCIFHGFVGGAKEACSKFFFRQPGHGTYRKLCLRV